jgi:hypothetical protein
MAPALPTSFIYEIRLDIIDENSYSDEEIRTFARKSITLVNPLINGSVVITDGTSVWDYSISGNEIEYSDFWEIVKLSTVYSMLKNYKNKMIAEGIGASVGIGSERVDTKTILITVKEDIAMYKSTLNQKILAYNLAHTDGVSVDLYTRRISW